MAAQPNLTARSLFKAMRHANHGAVRLRLPDGVWETFGQGEIQCEGRLADWEVAEIIVRRGDIGVAEMFIDGRLELDRPAGLISWACANEAELRRAIYGVAFALVWDRIRHWRQGNTLKGSKRNIASHYDLGNDFYRLWLDETLTYSSALFTPETPDLASAQTAKYERILKETGARAGDHILEIGCGWGGFFSYAAQRGCRVTAVTISQKQFEFCRERIAKEGLGGSVNLALQDYRQLRGRFDHVVSIEMIEAVGSSYWATYFAKIRECLKPEGRAVIQSITIREDLFNAYAKGTDFIQQYVFPGGLLPAPSTFERQGGRAGLGVITAHDFAASYERTCREWRERFLGVAGDVKSLGFGGEFMRLWEFYLAYCEGAFRSQRVGVSQFTLGPAA